MKCKKIVLAVATAGLIFSAVSASAGELVNEFGGFLAAGSSKPQNGASSSFGFGQLFYGRMFTPSFEGTLGGSYSTASGAAGATISTVGVNIGANYYFTPIGKASTAAWYVGGDVGSASSSGGGASSSDWSLNGGMKYFVTDSASINVAVKHQERRQTGLTTQTDMITLGASAFF